MTDKVYCDICGSDVFTIDEYGDLVFLQCGEPIEDVDGLEIELADTAYMN